MKKLLLIIIGLILLLAACGDKSAQNNKDSSAEDQPNEMVPVEKEQKEDNENGGVLAEVGQTFKDKELGATVELVAIKEINETIDLDPIKLHIEDIKIINMSEIKSRETKSFLKQFTDKEEFDYIQITYKLENTVEETVTLISPIEYVVLNTGEQIDVMMNDIILDHNNGGDFYGKVTKNSLVSVVIDSTNPKDIESIKLITGEVWDEEYNSLSDKVEVEYSID